MKAAMCLLLGLLAGCGTTLAEKANMTNEGARQLRKVAGPQISAVCLEKAKACAAANIEKEKCEPLTSCRKVRDSFYAAVEGVHMAMAMYKVKKAIGEPEKNLRGIIEAAQRGLQAAIDAAIKAGYLATSP